MNEEHRQIEVVDVGSGPPRPPRRPPADRTGLLLMLLVVGVFIGAGCSAFGAWTAHQTQRDQRLLNCLYVTVAGDSSDGPSYDELPKPEQRLVDRFDCDVPGR